MSLQQYDHHDPSLIAGHEEGETCNRNGCTGTIKLPRPENCSCHIAPPCAACTEQQPECDKCGWTQEDDEADNDIGVSRTN